MDLKLLLCFVMISPIFGDNLYPQTPQELMELDRARSAWNFGGHHAARINKKVALNQWGRQRSSVPASVITNRRQGTLPKVVGSTKKKSVRSSSPGSSMQPRQYKPYPKPVKPGKRTKVNRNVQSSSSPSMSMAPPAAAPQTYFPHPFYNQQQQAKPMWNRGSRMINSRSDTILNKFKKEDLWHLDKGEGYPLKNEDLEYDDFQRNYRKMSKGLDTNSIDDHHQGEDHHNQIEEDQHAHPHKHEREQQAEKLIKDAEDVICKKNHQTGEENAPNHIHHHHHYNDGKDQSHHEQKKLDPKKLTIAPLPRIHNPIPLGCLLTVPAFHPIRPRSHLACLLSIPGTPNLMKRRRKRSADSQQQQQQPLQSQSQIFQMFNGNQRMSPYGTRKHYSNHIGNGKTPLSQSQSMNSNMKVPATIIAPPAFDKTDLLSMLMGSGGVNPNEMGTILATNSRYVRFGRGLPNSGTGARKGRKLQWFSDSPKNQYHSSKHPSASSMTSLSSQQPSPSSSNHIPSMVKLSAPSSPPSSMVNQNQYSAPSPSLPQNPQVSSMLPPPPQYKASMMPHPKKHQQPSNIATPPLPLILNVHITPVGSRPSTSRGPVTTVPVPNSQQVPIPSSSHSYQHVAPSPSVKPEKYGEGFKYSEYWKPVSAHKENKKPQKPFNYDYYKPKYSNDIFSSSESKLSYSKVKPEVASEQLAENEGYQNQIFYNDENIEMIPPVEYYDNAIQDTDNGYVGESIHTTNEETPEYDHFFSSYGQDQNTEAGNKASNNIKTYSFAVKNNNELKTGLDFDILSASSSSSDYKDDDFSAPSRSSRDRSYFDSHISEGDRTDSNDLRMAETVSSRNQNFDNNYYYSLVRQLAGHSSEPIMINVPKDGPMSNEIKK